MTRSARPPLVARWLLALLLRGELHEVVRGDLDEAFADAIVAGATRRAAARRYWRQTLASLVAAREHARLTRSLTGTVTMSHTTRVTPLSGLVADLRQVLRRLSATPAFTAIAVASLAIGIGANTAIATVARAALLTPLPVERPHELALLYLQTPKGASIMQMNSNSYQDPGGGGRFSSVFTAPLFHRFETAMPNGTDVAGYTFLRGATVSVDGQPAISAGGVLASGRYFDVMRAPIVLGRGFVAADDTPGAEAVAVISHAFWQKAFGGNAGALRASVFVNSVPVRVVGVSGPGFQGPSRGGFFPAADITLPFATQPQVAPRWTSESGTLDTTHDLFWVSLIARIPPAVTRQSVEAALNTVARHYLVEVGKVTAADAPRVFTRAFDGARGLDLLRGSLAQSIFVISVVVGVILLVACLNVSSMMLARGIARQREMSVRRALGASRWQLIRITLLESAVLAGAGTLAGVVLAIWSRDALRAMVTTGLGSVALTFDLDITLIATSSAIGLVASLICGLLPAWRLSARGAEGALTTRPGGSTAPHQRLGRAMIAVQIALSVPMLIGAGLLLRTVYNLSAVDPGFRPDQLVIFSVDASANSRTPDVTGTIARYREILERVRAVPGVASATLVENALISNIQSGTTATVDGKEVNFMMNMIGPGFFDTTGIKLLAGRAPDDRDSEGAPQTIVINQTAAALFRGPAVGQHISANRYDRATRRQFPVDLEVIGVAADTKYTSLREPVRPTFYDAFAQRLGGPSAMNVLARVTEPPDALEADLRRAVAAVSPQIAVTGYRTQIEQIRRDMGLERVFARLLTAFGGIALLLACLGLYGVTSYAVAQRTNEIGIRMALGARGAHVVRLVLRQVLVVAVIGVAIGLPVAYLTRSFFESFLFQLTAADPVTFTGAALLMLLVAIGAGILPARRAAALDPLTSIRRD